MVDGGVNSLACLGAGTWGSEATFFGVSVMGRPRCKTFVVSQEVSAFKLGHCIAQWLS